MDISIIIVNYKSWDALSELLESLLGINTVQFSTEVIVIDNCSNDGKLLDFKTKYPKFQFIENTGNNGFANGCNFGAKHSKGDYLFFLNPDTVVKEEALLQLWQTAKKNANFGIVTCTQIDNGGKHYKENRFFPDLITLFGWSRSLYNLVKIKKIDTSISLKPDFIFPQWVTGAVVFMNKDWYYKVNGWNERYWLYYEDVDLCKRISNAGGQIALLTFTTILHKHGGASRINVKTKALTKTEVLISQHVFFQSHYNGIKLFVIQILLLFSHLVEKTVLFFLGLLFFFIPKLYVNVIIYKNLVSYYLGAIYNKTWTSPRSTLYKK